MDKKTLMAVVLILAVFWVSNEFIWKPKAEARLAAEKAEQLTQEKTQEKPVEVQENTEMELITLPTEITNQDIPIQNNLKLATKLDKDNVTYRFTNQGGLLTNAILSDFFSKDLETEELSQVDLISQNGTIYNIILDQRSGEKIDLSQIIFQTEISDDQSKITFTYNTDNGYIKKIYAISDLAYTLSMELEMKGFTGINSYQIQMDDGIPDTENHLKMKSRDYQVNYQLNNEFANFKLSQLKPYKELQEQPKLQEKFRLNGKVDWAAIRSKYFIQALIPEQRVSINQLEAFRAKGSPAVQMRIDVENDELHHKFQLYIGPLVSESLEPFSVGIDNCVEAGPGFLKWLSKIFLIVYLFIYSIIPSWGMSVIIFAVILKTLLYPLTHKSLESTTKMQQINPMMKVIQAKYKSDPKKMNDELRALYKEHGVNPMGGCLPMLLQMPILFAIYPIFRYSINLRQSSFIWLPDLSEPDPFYILPIIMAIFMFLQQKMMTPSKEKIEEMDEKQKAAMQSQRMMMYMMPLMMLFFFRSLASGLVLYWTVFSVIGTIQQVFIKRRFK